MSDLNELIADDPNTHDPAIILLDAGLASLAFTTYPELDILPEHLGGRGDFFNLKLDDKRATVHDLVYGIQVLKARGFKVDLTVKLTKGTAKYNQWITLASQAGIVKLGACKITDIDGSTYDFKEIIFNLFDTLSSTLESASEIELQFISYVGQNTGFKGDIQPLA